MDDPTPPDRFLGCYLSPLEATAHQMRWTLAVGHRTMSREQKEPSPYSVPEPNRLVRGYVYHMEEYMREGVDLYCSNLGISKGRLSTNFKTPFLNE